jgi:hypothetical protein
MELADLTHMAPLDFFDLGRSSLEEMASTIKRSGMDGAVWSDEAGDTLSIRLRNHEAPLIRLSAAEHSVPVIGVDTTNIELGQTERGVLCAVRGTVVKVEEGNYEYIRHGPFVFHITNRNRQTLYESLMESFLGMHESGAAPPLEKMTERIRSLLERWLQRQVSLAHRGALILWDGSLAAPRTSRSLPLMSRMLREARERENTVLAFSKKTTLTLWNGCHDLLDNRLAPSLLDIDEDARLNYAGQLCFLGYVYAAKLRQGSFTLRLDVDRSLPISKGVEGVEKLLTSDCLRENYPETLRLAHILSKFSAAEVIGIDCFIGKTYGLHIGQYPDVRGALLGPLEGNGLSKGVFVH